MTTSTRMRKKRRFLNQGSKKDTEENTVDTTDRISMLPDSIVHHILWYLLNDPKSRVRMSVLSKEWFALVASFPFFHFLRRNEPWDSLSCRKYHDEHIMDTFCKYVEYTVSRFSEQNISAHTLKISAKILNFEEVELFERCVDLVIAKGLQMMDIEFGFSANMPMVHLPNTLLSASSLTSLTLHYCKLPSSLMGGVVNLKSLRLLFLSRLQLDEGVIEYLTKGCPLLEEIYLKYCYGFKTFCVKRHQHLLKVKIVCDTTFLLERIDVEAPNLSYFRLEGNKDKAPSMFLESCKKLTTFCYRGFPLTRFSDLLSNFHFLENVALDLSSHVNNLKLSNHFLKRSIRLQTQCDLDEIVLNAPNLHLFEYYDKLYFYDFTPLSRKDSNLSKGCMKGHIADYSDILWFKKLRNFIEKNSILKVLKFIIHWGLPKVEELKLIESPPYKLEHLELKSRSLRKSPIYVALLDVALSCFRPRSLTLKLAADPINIRDVVEFTYEKLLQQESQGQTNIKFVLISDSVREQQFSRLNSLLKALSLGRSSCEITFIKEEGQSVRVSRRLRNSPNWQKDFVMG